MLIGELADAAGTTVRAIRYYEQQGLLRPRRTPNGYRDYDPSAVATVANIRLLLSQGLTTADVRGFGPCLDGDLDTGPVCPAGAAVIARRLAAVEQKLAALDHARGRLRAALDRA